MRVRALASVVVLLAAALSACPQESTAPAGDLTGPDNLTYPLVIVGTGVRDLYAKVFAINGDPLWRPCRTEVTTKLTIQKNGASVLEISGLKKTGGGVTDAAGNRDCSITEQIPEGWYLSGSARFSSNPFDQIVTFQGCNSGTGKGKVYWNTSPAKVDGEVSCIINNGNDSFTYGLAAMRTIAGTGQQ